VDGAACPWRRCHQRHVKTRLLSSLKSRTRAFTLVEMVIVMSVMALLLSVGIHALGDARGQARQAATDSITGMLEQARATAITSRCVVALALAGPDELPSGDARCRLGLFKIHDWPAAPTALDGTLVGRWQALPDGVVMLPGSVNGLHNPCDEPPVTIRYLAATRPVAGSFRLLAFSPRGTLLWPPGAEPLALRIAEGSYRNGEATANISNRSHAVAENLLQIGRLTARPYPFDR